jgi:uncharacterized membrane protein
VSSAPLTLRFTTGLRKTLFRLKVGEQLYECWSARPLRRLPENGAVYRVNGYSLGNEVHVVTILRRGRNRRAQGSWLLGFLLAVVAVLLAYAAAVLPGIVRAELRFARADALAREQSPPDSQRT